MKLVFYSDGKWEGGGIIPPGFGPVDDTACWIKRFASEFSDLKKVFLSALGNDGRIIGQEKADLILELDEALGGLILLRQQTIQGRPDEIMSVEGSPDPYRIRIFEKTWSGKGRLSENKRFFSRSFMEIHDQILLADAQKLLRALSSGENLHSMTDILISDILHTERFLFHSGDVL